MKINVMGKLGAGALELGAIKAFQNLGHEAIGVNPRKYRDGWPDADIQLVFRGTGLDPNRIAESKGLKVCWYSDYLPYLEDGIPSGGGLSFKRWKSLKKNLRAFDVIVTHNPNSESFLESRHPFVLAGPSYGVLHDRESAGPPLEERGHTIGFVGTMSGRRRRWMQELANRGVLVTRQGVRGKEYFDFIRSCRYFLNVHYQDQINTEQRIFEVLGCRTCLITESLSDPLIGSEHCVFAQSPEDVVEFMSLGIVRAQELATRGFSYVWKEHTQEERCQWLMDNLPI